MRPFTSLLPFKLAIMFGSSLIPLLFEPGTKFLQHLPTKKFPIRYPLHKPLH